MKDNIQLTHQVRAEILDRVKKVVLKRFYDPRFNGLDWPALVAERRAAILGCEPDQFERGVNELLRELKASHVGFFGARFKSASARQAVSATLIKAETSHGARWRFQDVHRGGAAHNAGIRSGDILLTLGQREVSTSESPAFPMGESIEADVVQSGMKTARLRLDVPDPRSKKQPVNVPEVVTAARMANGLGLIKISMFPGMVGIDVANSISAATRELMPDRLIVDLRGNTGGGMGCLRVMSYLCPDRRGVGHSVTRKKVDKGFDKENLPVFDRIPPTKLGLLPLIAKFALGDKSIAVKTEALGPQRFHGRIVVLVNQHSASASEMIAAFAAENGLATIVGEKTAGRVVGANSFKVGYGYRVALPVVEYRTWAGTVLESKGVVPDVLDPFSPDAAWSGVDGQVEKAIEIVNGLEERPAIH
jgi:carboxyl-terminal processing protease